jgi:hypothetical protein
MKMILDPKRENASLFCSVNFYQLWQRGELVAFTSPSHETRRMRSSRSLLSRSIHYHQATDDECLLHCFHSIDMCVLMWGSEKDVEAGDGSSAEWWSTKTKLDQQHDCLMAIGHKRTPWAIDQCARSCSLSRCLVLVHCGGVGLA